MTNNVQFSTLSNYTKLNDKIHVSFGTEVKQEYTINIPIHKKHKLEIRATHKGKKLNDFKLKSLKYDIDNDCIEVKNGYIYGLKIGQSNLIVTVNNEFKNILHINVIDVIQFEDVYVQEVLSMNYGDKRGNVTIDELNAVTDDKFPFYLFVNNKYIKKFNEFIYMLNLTKIKSCSFNDCVNLTEITIPKNIVEIGERAFENCESLETITMMSLEPPKISNNTFNNCNSLKTINVPAKGYIKYIKDPEWKKINVMFNPYK